MVNIIVKSKIVLFDDILLEQKNTKFGIIADGLSTGQDFRLHMASSVLTLVNIDSVRKILHTASGGLRLLGM